MTHKKPKNPNKTTHTIIKITSCLLSLFLLFAALTPAVVALRGNQTWAITLQMTEPGGAFDTVILSEAPDAADGAPQDSYDIPKPIPPIPPYIRAWFNDNLAAPYNQLWEDCRIYPDSSKTWNLSIQWFPQDGLNTPVTISWTPTDFTATEYSIIHLYHDGTFAADMTTQNSYTFTAPAYAPVSFTIECTTTGNLIPIANDDTSSTPEDTPVQINVPENDNDIDGTLDLTTVNIQTPPAHGTHAIHPTTGIITYTPNTSYYGSDSFTYTIKDNEGAESNIAQVDITITHTNQPPNVDDIPDQTTPEGTSFTQITLDDFVYDLEDPDHLIQWTYSTPTNLNVNINNRIATITPQDPEWNGQETIIFMAQDTEGLVDTDAATFTVTPVNDPPIANNDQYTVNENSVNNIFTVLDNDNDIDGDTLSIVSITQPAHGTASNEITEITFAPEPGYTGSTSLTYTITDNNGSSNIQATVQITIQNINDPPTASNDNDNLLEDATNHEINALQNDNDLDGDPLTIISTTPPLHGIATHTDNYVYYTPNSNYHGTDQFTYTITDGNGGTDTATIDLTITPVNDPPTATDDYQTVPEDSTNNQINALQNDQDIDQDPLTIVSVSIPTHGLATTNGNQIFYTPNPNYTGSDQFTYEITDSHTTDQATIYITIGGSNDPPEANDDQTTLTEDTTNHPIPVLTNDLDIDGDPLTIVSLSIPSHGTATEDDTTVYYTPTSNYHGTDQFTYTITDGQGGTDTATITLTITPINDPPIATDDTQTLPEDSTNTIINALQNDQDIDQDPLTIQSVENPSHGTTTIQNNQIHYTPNSNYEGTDQFTYTITDGQGGTDTATITLTITGINDPPTAIDDTFNVDENTQNNILQVLTNDNDIDADPLQILSITQPSIGTATHNTQTISYTPETNYSGTTTLSYTITDGQGGTDTATVTINIQTNNAPTTPTTPTGPTSGKTSNTYSFTTSSTDPESQTITYGWDITNDDTVDQWTTPQPSGSSISTSFSWTTTGTYHIKVKAKDAFGKETPWSNTHSITITKKTSSGGSSGSGGGPAPTYFPPVADASAGAPYDTETNTPIQFNGTNSYDQDGTITNYTWTINNTIKEGSLISHLFSIPGTYTIQLTVTDNHGLTNTEQFNVNIIKPNSPPTPPTIHGPTTLPINTPGTFTLTANDQDNDLIEFIVDWGDTTNEISPLTTQNQTLTHTYNTPGIYTITIITHDTHTPNTNSNSTPTTHTISIDAHDLSHHLNGYLIDTNSDGTYDIYHNNDLNQHTAVARELNGTYRIDIDGNQTWDYWYNINTDTIQPYNIVNLQTETYPLTIIIILAIILISMFFIIFGKLRPKKPQPSTKKPTPKKSSQKNTNKKSPSKTAKNSKKTKSSRSVTKKSKKTSKK